MAEYPGEVLQLVLVIIRDKFLSRLEAFLRPDLDDSLRCWVKDGLGRAGVCRPNSS